MLKQDHLIVQSQLEKLSEVQAWFHRFCDTATQPWIDEVFDPLNLALAEGFTNAVRHAHVDLPEETPIYLDISLWIDRIEMRIWDQGHPFDPDGLKEPKPGTLSEGGYGWFLLRRLADQVEYKRAQDDRNCLWIVKYPKTS
ncbi:MAG: anti-sigma regulatory factor [Cyanobacteria bacterium P01_A01_bin.114]